MLDAPVSGGMEGAQTRDLLVMAGGEPATLERARPLLDAVAKRVLYTGQIVAAELTTHEIDDGSRVGPLLEQVARPVASFTGDGAYDRDDVYSEVTERHPDAAVIVPPRSAAVPSAAAETTPTQRDRHLQLIAERGRMGWQRISGYNWRALVEADIGRFKRVIGDALRSRTERRRTTEVGVAVHVLNRMLELGRPEYVRFA